MNKKAQLGLGDLIAVIVLAVVVILFLVMMGMPGCSGKATKTLKSDTTNVMQAEGKIDLLTYLRSPVTLEVKTAKDVKETKTISIAEAISINTDDSQTAVFAALSGLLFNHNLESSSKQFIMIDYPNPTRKDYIGAVSGVTAEKPLSVVYVPHKDILIKIELWESYLSLGEIIQRASVLPGMKYYSEDKVYIYWGNEAGDEWADFGGAWALEDWPCEAETTKGVKCLNGYKPSLKADGACFVDGIQFAKYDIRPPKEGCQKKDGKGNVIEVYQP